MDNIEYRVEKSVTAEEFQTVLHTSGLGERRPVSDLERLGRMLSNSNLIVTARDKSKGMKLVGIARSVTDFSYCCYLSDLAVDRAYQRQGIGQKLIERTREAAGEEATLLLVAAPAAAEYYPHVGFEKQERAWTLPRKR